MTKKKNRKTNTFGASRGSETNSFSTYLREINRIPLLSKEEEAKVARLASLGNDAARERLITSNLRFVIMIAKRYQGKGLPLQDLISEGNIGLLIAANNFDVEKGCRFITYAVWWIRQTIIKAIHEKGRMIRLPSNKSIELTKIKKAWQIIQKEGGGTFGTEINDIALALDMSPEKTEDLISLNRQMLSLDDPIQKHRRPLAIKDVIEDEYSNCPVEHATNSLLRNELETAINGLEKRSAEVLRCRYGLGDIGPLTLEEVGSRYNISRERVRQIEKRALDQIQRSAQWKNINGFIA